MRSKPNLSFRRELRQSETDAERKLWTLLRSRRLGDFKFRRQHSIGPYIADFCCASAKLVVELDGGQHSSPKDSERDGYLAAQGYRVLRLWNDEFLKNPEACVREIERRLTLKGAELPPSPARPSAASTSPAKGGRRNLGDPGNLRNLSGMDLGRGS